VAASGAAGRARVAAAIVAGTLAAAGCTPTPDPASLSWDPHEVQNRQAHALNVAIDRGAWGPAARTYGTVVPAPVREGVSNLRENWRLPQHVLLYALQGRGDLAARSTLRFAINTTVGLGGVLDPATSLGVDYRYTNVDETLFVWGLQEGGYLELPVGGPGTERDWIGWALDIAVDPMTYVLPTEAVNALVGIAALDIVNDRYVLDPALESILYDSADSYTSLRISYLQNMRARLQGEADLDLLEDIYDF
jgi:phospholipid-binding lipoprotein MlaA